MTMILITAASQILIATCLAMYNEYIAYAYIISLAASYSIAALNYYKSKAMNEELLKAFKEMQNDNTTDDSDSDSDSSDSSS